jgi:hypothetical protein
MKDYLGQELLVGQHAISIEPGGGSSGPSSWNFKRVRILRMTAALVQVCAHDDMPCGTAEELARWQRRNTWKRSPHKMIAMPTKASLVNHDRLVAVGLALYMYGRWTCEGAPADDQARMWEALRDVLGLPAGTATDLGLGAKDVPCNATAYDVLCLRGDNSGHWYVIPLAYAADWDRWLESEAHDLGDVPSYAQRADGPTSLTFRKEGTSW